MAVKFVDSFPYNIDKVYLRYTGFYQPGGGTGKIESSGGRFNGRYITFSCGYGYTLGYVYKTIGGTEATLMVQCGYRDYSYAVNPHIITLLQGGSEQIKLVDEQGLLAVYRGATLLYKTATVISSNT